MNIDTDEPVQEDHARAPDEVLRARAVAEAGRSSELFELTNVWSRFVSGAFVVADCFEVRNQSHLLIRQTDSRVGIHGLTEREASLLERILLGQSQKEVAIEEGRSPSTIAMISTHGLRSLGVPRGASRAPVQLALLVHAHRTRTHAQYAHASQLRHLGVDYVVLTTMGVDMAFEAALSPAERVVLKLRVDGLALVDIARLRDTSARTIANQLAAAYRKCGVSRRSELLGRIARSEALVYHRRSGADSVEVGKQAV